MTRKAGSGPRSRITSPPDGRWCAARSLASSSCVDPGAGATIASLMAYSTERSLSKTPEKFGKGEMPASSRPRRQKQTRPRPARMIPLLDAGHSGLGLDLRILLAAFMLWGAASGAPCSWSRTRSWPGVLIASMYLGNVVLLAISIFAIPLFVQIHQGALLAFSAPASWSSVRSAPSPCTRASSRMYLMFCGRGSWASSCGSTASRPQPSCLALVLGPLRRGGAAPDDDDLAGVVSGIFFERPASALDHRG